MTVDRSSAVAARRPRVEWLALAGVATLVILGAAVLQAQARTRALAQQAGQLRVQARVVAENVLLQVGAVDNALAGVRDDFLHAGSDARALRAAQQRFRTLAAALPGVRAILVLDARGTVLAATRDELVGRNFSGRDYFRRARDARLRDVVAVSLPFETAQGEWAMPISRALLDEQGAFAGVVVAGLDSRYLAVVLRSVLYAPDMAVTLAHGEGEPFLHVRDDDPASRRPGRGAALLVPLATGASSAAVDPPEVRRAAPGGEARLVAARLVGAAAPALAPPMIVEVSRSVDGVLAAWRHDADVLTGLLALSLLLAVVALRMSQARRAEIAALAAGAQALQAETARRIRTVTDNLPALVAYLDHDHRYQFANARYRTFHDIDPAALIGRRLPEVIGREAYDALGERIAAVLRGEPQHFQQHGVAGKEDVHFNIDFIPDVEPGGRVAGFYVMVMDITALKQAQERLAALALFDTLTGLANRHQFGERLAGLLARPGAAVALMFLDVDRFKAINDALGHAAGDEVLREFARRLATTMRPTDFVARLAGDEFVVILDGPCDDAALAGVARKILAAVAAPFLVGDRALAVSTSIGIARTVSGTITPAELLGAADAALYEAKSNGRGTFALAPAGVAATGETR